MKVIVINRSRLERNAIAAMLDAEQGLQMTSSHSSMETGFKAIIQEDPDIIILSATDSVTAEAIRSIKGGGCSASVIVSGFSLEEHSVGEFAQVGASGYIRRNATEEQWIKAIVGAAVGDIPDGRIAGQLNRALREALRRRPARKNSSLDHAWTADRSDVTKSAERVGLTPRELQILKLIDKGMSNKQIATALNVEVSTVKNHVHSILAKYRVKRRSEAAACFRRTAIDHEADKAASRL